MDPAFIYMVSLYPYLQPTGENGATRAPISIDLHRDPSLNAKSIMLQIDNKSQQVSASESSILYAYLLIYFINFHIWTL